MVSMLHVNIYQVIIHNICQIKKDSCKPWKLWSAKLLRTSPFTRNFPTVVEMYILNQVFNIFKHNNMLVHSSDSHFSSFLLPFIILIEWPVKVNARLRKGATSFLNCIKKKKIRFPFQQILIVWYNGNYFRFGSRLICLQSKISSTVSKRSIRTGHKKITYSMNRDTLIYSN